MIVPRLERRARIPYGRIKMRTAKSLAHPAHGAEYWSVRELQPLPGDSQWRRFEQAIEHAISSCQQSGNPPEHHFADAGKPITG
jgi:hypothetical protein